MRRLIITGLVLSAVGSPLVSRAQGSPEDITELKRQIQELSQKVQDLEKREGVVETKTKAPPLVVAGANGFTMQSSDTNFTFNLHAVLQVDSRTFFSDNKNKGNDSFLIRRARPIISGTVYKNFDFFFMPDFGGSAVQIVDAYGNYRWRPELQLEVGKFKSPIGLEHLQADQYITFNERALPTDLVANRDVGIELHGDLWDGVVSYAAAFLNGSPDYNGTTTNSDFDNNKAFAGRLFFQPFKATAIDPLRGFGFGLGGSYQLDSGQTNSSANTGLTAGYTTDGQQRFFAYSNNVASIGSHWRLAPQAQYYYGPFGTFAEYVISDQHAYNFGTKKSAEIANTAWDVTALYNLTGEDATYTGVTPKHPFSLMDNQWGAWQIAARYGELSIDKAAFKGFADPGGSASEAKAWAIGLNWWLNRNVRVETSYSHTSFEGGAKGSVTKQPEEVLFTRVQVSF